MMLCAGFSLAFPVYAKTGVRACGVEVLSCRTAILIPGVV